MAIGNALEVKEAVMTLQGKGPKDLVDLVTYAGAIMLEQAHIVSNFEEGKERIKKSIEDGSGYNKLLEMFKAQGADISYLEDLSKLPLASHVVPLYSEKEGYVSKLDCLKLGISAMKLGAGRETMDDKIDMSAGIVLNKKLGDKVNKGELLCYIHTNKDSYEEVVKDVISSFHIQKEPVKIHPIVHEYIK